MPDKHEVGGSSPLGPTKELGEKNPSKRKHRVLFSKRKRRDKFFNRWFESTWAYQASEACNEIFDCVKSEIRKRMKFFDRSKSEIFTS